ncbi:methylthioribose-1-phosphate isomerase [Sciscionella sediminilitoris]|uniref:methylthioribose-1-phosphate isomerase n=1 Tax=Sciscionella sediminilitoris TaxID=1445613 RepID=UPI0004DF3272|nr:methylthioribose-1-phosphate isomerase [Sciscionella sp. SE31]
MSAIPVPTLLDSVRIEPDVVRILDRRRFPMRTTWVECRDVEQVAVAIEDMVTQSCGPFFAAAGAMVLAAGQGRSLDTAARRLLATRPTNNGIREAVTALRGVEPERMFTEANRISDEFHERGRRLGAHAAARFADGDVILTHCWGDVYVIGVLRAILERGDSVRVICTETRPYLQGARLTAHSVAELGMDVSVITDGMPAALMSQGRIDKLLTAADRVTMDGHVVNKVGTLGLAIAARHFGVPYTATVFAPDEQAETGSQVPLEDRDGAEVLHALGNRTASERATGIYPAFDVTPPELVGAIGTDRGVFAPERVRGYYQTGPV